MSQLITSSVPSEEEAVLLEHQQLAESNSHLSTLGYRMTNLHFTSILVCYEGDLPVRQISHTVFYITDITVFCWLLPFLILRSSFGIHLLPFQKFSAWYLFALTQLRFQAHFVRVFFFFFRFPGSSFWLLCLSPENWTTRPILICAFNLSGKHFKQFHSGWSKLCSLEGHSSTTTRKWLFPGTLFWSSSIRIASV